MKTTPEPEAQSRNHALMRVLTEIETGFPRWQHTLMYGKPGEIEECTRAFASFSAEANTLLRCGAAESIGHQWLSSAALRIRRHGCVFLAILRRVRRVRDARSLARAGCSQIYALPAAAHGKAAF